MSTSSSREPIAVGVEGSKRSADALALADLLAPLLDRSVLIAFVHSYGDVSGLLGEGDYQRLVRRVAEETFHDVREHLPSVGEREMRLVGDRSAAAGLHDLAERANASLLVVGSSHRSRLGRILPGGTAERLLSGAPAPVAVAPAGYAKGKAQVRTVGCAFDGSPESRHALEWAAGLARAASAKLRVIGVHEPLLSASVSIEGGLPVGSLNEVLRQEQKTEIEEAAAAHSSGLDVSAELLEGDAASVLAQVSPELDLLVLGSRGYGPVRAVLVGSVSLALMRSAETPIVVTPRGADAPLPGTRANPRQRDREDDANGRNAPSTEPASGARMGS